MKKVFLFSLLFITTNAFAATPWWQQPTVCRLNPANCYTTMGTGYDSGMWDANANCWGMKLICGDALTNTNNDTLVGRTEIAHGTNINSDYDVNVLNGGCFGVRRTSTDGTRVSVDGRMVRVWCNDVLELVNKPVVETIESGQVTYDNTQPSCGDLAAENYVAVANGKCFGKYYDSGRYYVQCNGEIPTLIVLNGASSSYETGNTSYPITQADADALFNQMYERVHQ